MKFDSKQKTVEKFEIPPSNHYPKTTEILLALLSLYACTVSITVDASTALYNSGPMVPVGNVPHLHPCSFIVPREPSTLVLLTSAFK